MVTSGMLTASRNSFMCCSLRHWLLLLLLFGVTLIFYTTNVVELTDQWSPERWLINKTGALNGIYQSPKESEQSRVNDRQQDTISPAGNISTWTKAQTQIQVQTQLQTQGPPPPVVPYESPGPYRVEYPHQYHFLINEPQRCQREEPFVVLMVPVAPRNRAARDAIRSTWGGNRMVKGKAVMLFFMLGLQDQDEDRRLTQESQEHQDLIQSDFIDCYKNLTIKTMVMLEWLDSHCSRAAYAMKIDSDMFLNVDNLVSMLLKAPKTDYMTGLVALNALVLRDPKSKWYLPEDIYPDSHYPRYALGLGYVLSSDLPRKLVEASRHVRTVYIEDVYLGLCMKYLGIHPTNPMSGRDFHVLPLTYSRCAFSTIIATTLSPHMDLVKLWKDFKAPGPAC